MQTGDFIKIVKGNFRGYYAVITEESYGDEIEIRDLELVEGVFINTRGHYRFEN